MPKQVPLAEARAFNAIAGKRRKLTFTAGGASWELQLRNRLAGYVAGWQFGLKVGDDPAMLELERLPDLGRCNPAFANVALDDLPKELWVGVLETALEPLLEVAGQALHARIDLADLPPGATEVPPQQGIFFELNQVGQPLFLRGRVVVDDAGLQRVAALLGSTPAQAPADAFGLVPFRAQLVIGETRLAVGDFQRLERGDIVLLDRHANSQMPLCDLAFTDALRFRMRQQEGRFILDRMATDTAPAPSAAPAAAPTASLDSLPVHLVFEAGEKRLTLGDLRQLDSGYTFELDAPADKPLTIRANGQAIGTGELVQIGDRLGVRVLEWTTSATPA